MNLLLEADWELTDDAKPFLRDYFFARIREAAHPVRLAYPALPADPIDAYHGTMVLHLYKYATPTGQGGEYISLLGENVYGFYTPDPQCRINVAWYWEYERQFETDENGNYRLAHHNLWHESRHWLAHMISGKGVFGHGRPEPPKYELDPLLELYMKPLLASVYQTDTDKSPDVYLCHRANPGVEL